LWFAGTMVIMSVLLPSPASSVFEFAKSLRNGASPWPGLLFSESLPSPISGEISAKRVIDALGMACRLPDGQIWSSWW